MKFSPLVLLLLIGLSHTASANWFDDADPSVIYANALPAFEDKRVVHTEDQTPQVTWGVNEASVSTKAYPSFEQLRAYGVINEVVSTASIEKPVVSSYQAVAKPIITQSFDIVMREMELQRLKDLALLKQRVDEELQSFYAKREASPVSVEY